MKGNVIDNYSKESASFQMSNFTTCFFDNEDLYLSRLLYLMISWQMLDKDTFFLISFISV